MEGIVQVFIMQDIWILSVWVTAQLGSIIDDRSTEKKTLVVEVDAFININYNISFIYKYGFLRVCPSVN